MTRENDPSRASDAAPMVHMIVGGEQVESESGETRPAHEPATGDVLAHVPVGTRGDVRRALGAASEAQPELAAMTAFERAELVREIGDAIEDRLDDLAEWLTRDQGKPLGSARGELELVVRMYRNAAAEIEHDETPSFTSEDPDKRMFSMREPHGVYGVITPWNFPTTIPSEYVAPGLAVGNAIVWVPAPTTSVISAKLAEVICETSLPAGALNLVTGEGPVVGNELVESDDTDAIGFTGSPETGDRIARDAGAKPTLLELGGNGPVIVMDDADLDAAAARATAGCFGNAGQICTATERILVHEAVAEEFTERVLEHARDVVLGDPLDPETTMGPLNNEDVAAKMDRHVADAVEAGAELLLGGARREDAPTDLYYEPTVLADVTPETLVNHEETFGPIAPIIEVADADEAIRIANAIDLGLSCGVFTSAIDAMYEFAERIESGLVNVNDGSAYWEIHTPIGGYTGTDSGVGRIGGRFTIEEMSQLKNVTVDTANLRSRTG